ncbi:Tannase/feruloyl esterase [Penicillium cf. griseofulvum]|uniref:Carboxylic ester hydrolase n=1 Tax=Penicillium cf. griseofulvum TaxID=2972120 RepID=A0A9W9INK4_9EURO|nr:Tannase/feruloyl esterase [Penicillium cf. griseofulvum]KAJ5451450.1 Tannase/feruloyl esterase [Penicillium cf. griseofulvum]
MRLSWGASVASLAASASAASLADVCAVSNVQSALPSDGTLLGINMIPSAVTANAVYNVSAGMGSTETYTYCNVTVTYEHTGKGDSVVIKYAFPKPSDFKKRFYVAGGGGFSLSSDATGGLEYGAVSGATSAGYDAFNYSYDDVVLYGNGTINWDATYMFGYQALGEMAKIGKVITQGFYGLSSSAKVYTYYEGCSDGGREGMSQIQRYGEEYDGAITGAPAFLNATIAACDPLDGRTDGVISRTDLCKLSFNLSSIIGEEYYCAAETSTSLGFGFSKRADGTSTSTRPEQSGKVTAQGVKVAQTIYGGLHNTKGERAYLSWQIGSELSDSDTQWNNATSKWELNIPSTGGVYVTKFIQLQDLSNLSNLENVTYDTLVEWMTTGMVRYMDSLQTTLPDLTSFQSSGGKLLHYHGESDPSIPAASSVHYWQSVRSIMYPHLSSRDSLKELADWYQFYLIPGAAHCGTNTLQPGPFPENNMQTMIDWVENGVKPSRLNATVSSGTYEGETQMLCQWPTRPLWKSNSSFVCVDDKASIDSWTYSFPAFKMPVY